MENVNTENVNLSKKLLHIVQFVIVSSNINNYFINHV